jgi:hypothetical protein
MQSETCNEFYFDSSGFGIDMVTSEMKGFLSSSLLKKCSFFLSFPNIVVIKFTLEIFSFFSVLLTKNIILVPHGIT